MHIHLHVYVADHNYEPDQVCHVNVAIVYLVTSLLNLTTQHLFVVRSSLEHVRLNLEFSGRAIISQLKYILGAALSCSTPETALLVSSSHKQYFHN